ncbi:hypothetical protein BZG36_00277 [Bifiguratus adelaidae]|uniref:1-phosphatidylinositol-3-phosphate 5-kinase n=1 Tax=Bifiguratus adelaidae TaxID=1938954 RepID=A0A261Y7S5_9FUNG|nr:hypothetical protein BZG36_00277 [Bifiguratus adelaidae]
MPAGHILPLNTRLFPAGHDDPTTLTSFNIEENEEAIETENAFSKFFSKVRSSWSGSERETAERASRSYSTSAESTIHERPQEELFEPLPNFQTSTPPQASRKGSLSTQTSNRSEQTHYITSTQANGKLVVKSDGNRRSNEMPQTLRNYEHTGTTLATTSITGTDSHRNGQGDDSSITSPPANAAKPPKPPAPRIQIPSPPQYSSTASPLPLEYNTPDSKSPSDSDAASIRTTFSVSTSNSLARVIRKLRGDGMNKDYWMPDDNCRECYECKKPFTVFRRKHHCRICGQIFCANCASHILPGAKFNVEGAVRVCNYCHRAMNAYEEDEFDDDASVNDFIYSLPTSHEGFNPASPVVPQHEPPISAPRMSIRTTAFKRQPSEYGGDATTTLEIAATKGQRSPTHSTKSPRMYDGHGPNAPPSPSETVSETGLRRMFQNTLSLGGRARSSTLTTLNTPDHSAFPGSPTPSTSINVLYGGQSPAYFRRQPNWAPYVAVDSGGGAVLEDPDYYYDPNAWDQDDAESTGPTNFLNFLTSSGFIGGDYGMPSHPATPGAQRYLQESDSLLAHTAGGGSDDESHEQLARQVSRFNQALQRNEAALIRRRSLTLSSPSVYHIRPQRSKSRSLLRHMHIQSMLSPLDTSVSSLDKSAGHFGREYLDSPLASAPSNFSYLADSDMGLTLSPSISRHRRTSSRPLNIELNAASMNHMRQLLRQTLKDVDILDASKLAEWEEVLMGLLLKVSDHIQTNVRAGDEIDIRHYVKIKRIAGGNAKDSFYVKGIVCSKNVAHKQMAKNIPNPRIMILFFPLEYARVENQFMSLEPVLAQEKAHLHNLVSRIAALRPDIILVQSSVSRIAMDYLMQQKITVVHNVKQSVLEAVARCTNATIIPSIDKLSLGEQQLGHCDSFKALTYLHEYIAHRRKSFLVFDGCKQDLGCTLVLRGGKEDELRHLKRIADFMVFVVNNLRLETFLMNNEFAMTMSTMQSQVSESQLIDAAADTTDDLTTSTDTKVPQINIVGESENGKTDVGKAPEQPTEQSERAMVEDDERVKPIIESLKQYESTILSASPFVHFPPPYLLLRMRDEETRLAIFRLQKQGLYPNSDATAVTLKDKDDGDVANGAVLKELSIIKKSTELAAYEEDYEQLLEEHNQQIRAWEVYLMENSHKISPFLHQNIVVLYSNVCTVTTVPCQGPEIRMFSYYQDSDITLGQYLEALCLDANKPCLSPICERPLMLHYRVYAHGNSRVTVVMEKFPCPLVGMSDVILMWSFCNICKKATPVVPMSDDTYKYSFGKYLELSFYHSEMFCRADICSHNINRDHVRYFGFRDIAVRFQTEAIDLLEVRVPPIRLYVIAEDRMALKDKEMEALRSRISKYYDSISERLRNFVYDIVNPIKVEQCKAEIQELSRKVTSEKKHFLQAAQQLYASTPATDALSINQMYTRLQDRMWQWDQDFAEIARQYFQPERELRRMTAAQLRRMFPEMKDIPLTNQSAVDYRTDRAVGVPDLPILGTSPDVNVDYRTIISPNAPSTVAATPSPEISFPSLSTSPEDGTPFIDNFLAQKPGNLASGKTAETISTPSHISAATRLARRLSIELMKDFERSERKAKEASEAEVMREQQQRLQRLSSTPEPDDLAASFAKGLMKKSNRLGTGAIATRYASNAVDVASRKGPLPNAMKKKGLPDASGKTTPTRPTKLKRPNADKSTTPTPGGRSDVEQRRILSREPSAEDNRLAKFKRPTNIPRVPNIPLIQRTRIGRPRQSRSFIEVYQNKTDFAKEVDSDDEFPGSDEEPVPPNPSFRSALRKHRLAMMGSADTFDQAIGTELMSDLFANSTYYNRLRPRQLTSILPLLGRDATTPTARPSVGSLSLEPVKTNDSAEQMGPKSNQKGNGSIEDLLSRRSSNSESGTPSLCDNDSKSTLSTTVPVDQLVSSMQSNELSETTSNNKDGNSLAESSLTTLPLANQELNVTAAEKTSIMKTITNLWLERAGGSFMPLEYPLLPTEHVFSDAPIVIREDEPSSIIAYTLSCQDYMEQLRAMQDMHVDGGGTVEESVLSGEEMESLDTQDVNDWVNLDFGDHHAQGTDIEKTLLRDTGTHIRYNFTDGTTKFFCKIFYAEQFDALRKNCGCESGYIASLARCVKWDSSGGKSGSAFLKTKDDRLMMKQMSKYELDAFLRFAPAYFHYMSEAFFHDLPTVLAKIYGFYRIGYKNPATGKSMKMDVLVMENLFYNRKVSKIFDLKGSLRNRHVQSTGRENEVLLDENLVELMYQSPLFIREHSKEILRGSLHNDTLFLSKLKVMDYSLLLGIDEERKELIVGIVDFIRTFTWDKKLESWVKESGFLGGGGKEPTIVSPRQYRLRFKEAMERYFLLVPDVWVTPKMSGWRDMQQYDQQHHHDQSY